MTVSQAISSEVGPLRLLSESVAALLETFKTNSAIFGRIGHFWAQEAQLNGHVKPMHATPHRLLADLRTMNLLDYSDQGANGIPTIVLAPYAGHTSTIADYDPGQSLMQTLRISGPRRLYLTDWKSATQDMADMDISDYLSEIDGVVDSLGGRANLVGLCQGGWMAAMYAARFPAKVQSLVAAGSPLDTHAGNGALKKLVQDTQSFVYEALVASGGGLMRGAYMLTGWKSTNLYQHYVGKHYDLFEHVDDEVWLKKTATFDAWYENTVDLPGRWYLQAITQLFRENRFAKGEFEALGRTLSLADVTCPIYLLAGSEDDITPPEQVFEAAHLFGTDPGKIQRDLVPGGHIGLFMGSRTLRDTWPTVGRWIAACT